jgi:glycerate 2-kinase
VPAVVRQHLLRSDPAQETVKGAEFERTRFRVFGIMPNKLGLLRTAAARAEELGYAVHIMSENLRAEARESGRVWGAIARNIEDKGSPFPAPCVMLSGGEVVVTTGAEPGVGGRNQEVTLAAAMEIAGSPHIVVGAVDSDGTDGPGGQFMGADYPIPNLAGGLVDGQTMAEAKAAGVDIHAELMRHNTTPALWTVHSGILATHNISLNDLCVTLIMGSSE